MKKSLARNIVYALPYVAPYLLIIMGIYLAGLGSSNGFVDIKLEVKDNRTGRVITKKVDLPYREQTSKHTISTFHLNLKQHWYSGESFIIKPDDCINSISVNSHNINLAEYQRDLCNVGKGITVNFSDYLSSGDNTLIIVANNKNGGFHGLQLESKSDLMTHLGLILTLLGVLVVLHSLCKHHQIGFFTFAALAIAVGLRFYYFDNTLPTERTHDIEGHIEYITKIQDTWNVPEDKDCWVCYHPPLYYFSAAVYTSTIDFITNLHSQKIMQSYSLLLSVVFLFYGILLLRRLLPDYLHAPAILMLLFWPASILYSARIGNDSMLYLAQVMGLYYLIKWDGEKNTNLYLSLACWVASILIKSNGIFLLVPIIVRYIIVRKSSLGDVFKGPMVKEISVIAVIVLGAASFIAYDRWSTVSKSNNMDNSQLVVGNYKNLPKNINIHNNVEKMILFDSRDFFQETYTYPWRDSGGRQYYWNYLIKTAITGEHDHSHIDKIRYPILALKLIFTLGLIIVVLGIFNRIHTENQNDYKVTLLSYGLIMLAASMALRWQIPVAPSQDFRYIFPVIFVVIPLLLTGIQTIFKSRAKLASYFTALIFSISTFYFYVAVL